MRQAASKVIALLAGKLLTVTGLPSVDHDTPFMQTSNWQDGKSKPRKLDLVALVAR